MKKYVVETYYTCTFKTIHTLDDLNDKELSKIDERTDGNVELIDVKLNNRKTKKIGDPGGFCAVWCVWYINMRLKYDMLDRIKLVKKLIQKIKEENIPFKTLVRNYAKKIIDIRDEVLVESNLDINDWLNSNYELPVYENFIINIKKKIVSLI